MAAPAGASFLLREGDLGSVLGTAQPQPALPCPQALLSWPVPVLPLRPLWPWILLLILLLLQGARSAPVLGLSPPCPALPNPNSVTLGFEKFRSWADGMFWGN